MSPETVEDLTAQLDSFQADRRRAALQRLLELVGPDALAERRAEVNLHCHTFFSYNAYGYSPSRFAWEACRYGLEVAGIVDFDVLDGVEEFLDAGQLLGLKTVAGFETRAFVEEYADRVTNSPHEPGVSYLVGAGFLAPPDPGTGAASTLRSMRECAERRNRTMLGRVNARLDPVAVDYDADVLPLTPAGNATERHMLVALERRAREVFPDDARLAAFWSEKLGEPLDGIQRLLGDVVALKNLMRRRLMKYGGVGYAAPRQGSFPDLDAVVELALTCGALPSGAWLDGTNDGERDPVELYEFWLAKGIPTVTIIPERNWNVSDASEKPVKLENLRAAVAAASDLDMPILAGTEMNADGQKFVDTFSAPELTPYRQAFLDGAHFAWGHTLLRMTAGIGATGAWAIEHFGDDRARRNAFFQRVGRAPYPRADVLRQLSAEGPQARPEVVLRVVEA
ncbi:MAG: PHP domain-containing protein [Planctomycetota bacterium]|jgi:hypothetical protein